MEGGWRLRISLGHWRRLDAEKGVKEGGWRLRFSQGYNIHNNERVSDRDRWVEIPNAYS